MRSVALLIHSYSLKLFSRKMSIANGSQPKRVKGSSKWIGTHNGQFHCDEALACYMLKCLPEYRNAEVIRTRDPALLDMCDIVVDVGGVYDPPKLRFDHHQRTFQLSLKEIIPNCSFKTRLSSAGLIYAHFGRQVIKQILNLHENSSSDEVDSFDENESCLIKVLFTKCYENFMEEIDANDNGISQHDDKAKFLVNSTLSMRVARLNPWWNAKEKNEDDAFQKAMNLVGGELVESLEYLYLCWWPARGLVKQAIETRLDVDESGEVILFKSGGYPWKEHLFQLEQDLKLKPIKYVLYPDERNGNWMINCVPVEKNSFQSRTPLPESWRGLRDEQLSNLIMIENSVFCHATGFCGGHKSKEGALRMVRAAMQVG